MMLRWSFLWIFLVAGMSGLIDWWTDLDISTWQIQLRWIAAFTFLLALAAGSIFTFSRKRFYREEWSFILILVTVGLFGISFIS